jgi:hypothetical protein
MAQGSRLPCTEGVRVGVIPKAFTFLGAGTGEPDDAKVSRPVRGGAGRKGSNDLARGLPYLCSRFQPRLMPGVGLWHGSRREDSRSMARRVPHCRTVRPKRNIGAARKGDRPAAERPPVRSEGRTSARSSLHTGGPADALEHSDPPTSTQGQTALSVRAPRTRVVQRPRTPPPVSAQVGLPARLGAAYSGLIGDSVSDGPPDNLERTQDGDTAFRH